MATRNQHDVQPRETKLTGSCDASLWFQRAMISGVSFLVEFAAGSSKLELVVIAR